LIVNLRAEGDPEVLREVVGSALDAIANSHKLTCDREHMEAFRPGKPTPTHRLAAV